jgi:hypothetical protein
MAPEPKFTKVFRITLTPERCKELGMGIGETLKVRVKSDRKIPSPGELPKDPLVRNRNSQSRVPIYGPFKDLNAFWEVLYSKPNKRNLQSDVTDRPRYKHSHNKETL